MAKIYRGVKNRGYLYTVNPEDLESVRDEINVDIADSDTARWFSEIFGKDIPAAPGFDWTYKEGSTKARRDELEVLISQEAEAPVKETIKVEKVVMVKCSCGHTVPKSLVMCTSAGTSCPDCYDRMSE